MGMCMSVQKVEELNQPVAVSIQNEREKGLALNPNRLLCFSYSVLEAATHKFNTKNLIGQGGFGDVYLGYLNSGTMTSAAKPNCGCRVAVKRLRSEHGAEGHKEWLNEMKFLSRLNHQNVVKLVGYCSEGECRILVYEYLSRGSLESQLLKDKETKLNWSKRIDIAIGTARGLDYLHTYATPVIHRDLKASNILLDSDFNAKVSDFGLAKYGPQGDQSHLCTRVLGTKGYFAPEYIATGHLTLKTDIYSLGVLLLEIFSGSSVIKKYSNGEEENLVQWAIPYLTHNLRQQCVIDKRLGNKFPTKKAQEFAKIIVNCLSSNPKIRPTSTQVLNSLEQLHSFQYPKHAC